MLCRELGFAHPDELLEELTPRQIQDWLIYYSINPFGAKHENYRTALLATVINRSAGGTAEIDNFLPVRQRTTPKSDEELMEIMRGVRGAQNRYCENRNRGKDIANHQ